MECKSVAAAVTAEQLLAQVESLKSKDDIDDSNIAEQVNLALITCDERCLAVFDANEIHEFKDDVLIGRTRHCVNLLMEKLAMLPTEPSDEGNVTKLPDPKTVLPRFKRMPKRDEFLTKWDRFARTKGIQKKKRSRRVFDPDTEHWKPRFGYDREAKSFEKESDWLIEVPANSDPYEDQFQKRAHDKRESVAKNELQRLRNLSRKMKVTNADNPDWQPAEFPSVLDRTGNSATKRKAGDAGLNGSSKKTKVAIGVLPDAIPDASLVRGNTANRFVKLSRAHHDVKLAYENARVATASLGRFDQRSRRETNLEKSTKVLKNRSVKDPQAASKRVHFDKPEVIGKSSGVADVRNEKDGYLRVLDSLASRRAAKQPINDAALDKAANRATAREQADRADAKVKSNHAGPKNAKSHSKSDSRTSGRSGKFESKRFGNSRGKGFSSRGGSKGGRGGFRGGSRDGSNDGSRGGFSGNKSGGRGGFRGGNRGGSRGGFRGGNRGGGRGGSRGGSRGGGRGRKG